MTITFRSTKGSRLTVAEGDENIRDLDSRSTDPVFAGDITVTGTGSHSSVTCFWL